MNPNKRPPPSSAGAFEGGDGVRDATKRARDFPDGKILRPGQEQPGNVLLVRVTDIVHPVTILALQQIFSRFGKVDKIVMFDKGSGFQALVQMADVYVAMNAHEAADMQEMYSGCNLIRVGYSNLQNVTVKGNTERSWDFNIGPPLEGALPQATSSSPAPAARAAAGAGAGGSGGSGSGGSGSGGSFRRSAAGSSPAVAATTSSGSQAVIPNPTSSPVNRHTAPPQASYSAQKQQQYSPYSAATQQHLAPPYASNPQQQQTYGTHPPPGQQSSYATQHSPFNGGGASSSLYGQQQQQQQQTPNGMQAGGGGSYAPAAPYAAAQQQSGYGAAPFGQGPAVAPYSQQPYNPQQTYGRHHDNSSSSSSSTGATTVGVAAASGGGGGGSYTRPPPPQPPGSYYHPSSPNVMPPHQGGSGGPAGGSAYGSIPFSSERSPAGGGFRSMGIGGARPMPHSGRPGMGGGGGGLGAGGPGGGGGVGHQERASGYNHAGARGGPPVPGSGGGGGGGLLQPPMHHRGGVPDGTAFRPQMRFRSSSEKTSSGATASGGARTTPKPRSRLPRLNPLHIQALTTAAAVAAAMPAAKKTARHHHHEEPEEEAGGGGRSSSRVGGGGKTLPGFVKEMSSSARAIGSITTSKDKAGGGGKGGSVVGSASSAVTAAVGAGAAGSGNRKNANKREAAEMLGPADTTDQLAAATAKVRVSDVGSVAGAVAKMAVAAGEGEDGEGKRVNKREAAEMLGPDATDQLAAATARVRVSDDGEGGEETASSREDGGGRVKSALGATEAKGKANSFGVDGPQVEGGKRKASAAKEIDGARTGKDDGSVTVVADGDDGAAGEVENQATGEGKEDGGGNEVSSNRAVVVEDDGSTTAALSGAEGGGGGAALVGSARVDDVGAEVGLGGQHTGNKRRGRSSGNKSADIKANRGSQEPGSKSEEPAADADHPEESAGKGKEGESANGDKEPEGDVAEEEGKVRSQVEGEEEGEEEDDDDEAEAVDVGAWAAAAPAARPPIIMVLRVDTQEVSPGALCQLFGLYGDVMKVKLVSSRGMALIQMRYPVQAVNAQRLLDQTPLCGMLLEVKASSQWTINDPTATNFSQFKGVHRYETVPSPEDSRYRDCLSPPCPTLVVDDVSPDVSAEELTAIFAKHGTVSSVDLDTQAKTSSDAASPLPVTGGSSRSEPKPSVQALVHMDADGKVGATEAAVHALVMTHNLTLHERRLRVSFLSVGRHVEK